MMPLITASSSTDQAVAWIDRKGAVDAQDEISDGPGIANVEQYGHATGDENVVGVDVA